MCGNASFASVRRPGANSDCRRAVLCGIMHFNKFQKKCIAPLLFCALLTASALSGGCAADQRGASETEKTTDYILYEEPLSLVSGVQTQFPVVLSEYRFYDREDVDTYLALLETTGEYFDSLIAFEQKKSEAGLFMADYAADTVITACNNT